MWLEHRELRTHIDDAYNTNFPDKFQNINFSLPEIVIPKLFSFPNYSLLYLSSSGKLKAIKVTKYSVAGVVKLM